MVTDCHLLVHGDQSRAELWNYGQNAGFCLGLIFDKAEADLLLNLNWRDTG